MEIILVLSLAIGLAILASRYGHDSRDRFYSEEELRAAQGFTWRSEATRHAASPPAAPRLAAPSRLPR